MLSIQDSTVNIVGREEDVTKLWLPPITIVITYQCKLGSNLFFKSNLVSPSTFTDLPKSKAHILESYFIAQRDKKVTI